MPDDEDSSDASDSDYDPTHNEGGDDAVAASSAGRVQSREEGTSLPEMSYSRKRKANTLWEEMNSIDKEYTRHRMERSLPSLNSSRIKPTKSVKSKRILEGIFGKTETASLLQIADFSKGTNCTIDNVDVKERIRKSVQSLAKRQTVTETRKFAGQNIT